MTYLVHPKLPISSLFKKQAASHAFHRDKKAQAAHLGLVVGDSGPSECDSKEEKTVLVENLP